MEVGSVVLTREYGISATSPPTPHSPQGMRQWRWKETEIRGRNKLSTSLPPENSMCRVSNTVAFEKRIHPPLRVRGNSEQGGGGSEKTQIELCSLARWQVIATAGSELHIVSSPFKPNHKYPDSQFHFLISKNLVRTTETKFNLIFSLFIRWAWTNTDWKSY